MKATPERNAISVQGRKKAFVAVLSTMLVLLSVAMVGRIIDSRPREPVYQEEPLSFWLGLYASWTGTNILQDHRKASEAISAIGTNAIPMLLRMLRAQDTAFKLSLARFVERRSESSILPQSAKNALARIRPTPAAELHRRAALGFKVLSHDARCAAPAVIEICQARISPSSERWATCTLGEIGGQQALLALLCGTTNSNPRLRQDSLVALADGHFDPELTVSVLTNAFADPDAKVRLWACNRFGLSDNDGWGAMVKALPALQPLLKDPDPQVRKEAAGVLKKFEQTRSAKQ